MTADLDAELLPYLAAGDRRGAADLSVELVAGGMSLARLVGDALAPVMREVGRRWESAEWTVADEHAATAVIEAALSAAAAESGGRRWRGEVVVSCVEGDWHSLPSRMVAEVMEELGWGVRFLGASQPIDLLVGHVERYAPEAVLLTCSVPMALPSLAETVARLRLLGVPVYVGGRALGDGPHRATVLGADGWGSHAAACGPLLDGASGGIPRQQGGGHPASAALERYREAAALFDRWAEAAGEAIVEAMHEVAGYPTAVRARTGDDLRHLLDMAAISTLVADPGLLDEQVAWLRGVLAARRVDPRSVDHGLRALVATAPEGERAAEVAEVLGTLAGHAAVGVRLRG